MRILFPLIGLSIATAAAALTLSVGPSSEAALEPVSVEGGGLDFARDIRPILADNCLQCHGFDPATREAGLRLDRRVDALAEIAPGVRPIVPGDPDSSEAYLRMTEPFADDRMPPPGSGKSLSEREIEVFRRWIEAGAVWSEHWSFIPPAEPTVPVTLHEGWVRSDLDRFVAARLEGAGLSPNPEADRRTLIRRVSLDLIGLPPSPAEVEAFVRDTSAGAYEALVDRLLASEHFGERWARVWLDLARYADTKGYEADRRRTMWPYRDWVIDAFNKDLPFDAFTQAQLAGDMGPEPGQADLVATGFHRNTMTNDEGGTDDEEFRVAAVVDRVNTTMTVWMGLTANCAQCHTHKYDPITQTEYYRLFAIFNTTTDADRMDEAPNLAVLSDGDRAAVAARREQIAALQADLDSMIVPSAYKEPTSAPAAATPVFVPIVGPLLPYSLTLDGGESWPWKGGEGDERTWRLDAGDAFTQRFFTDMYPPLEVRAGDRLSFRVRLDRDRPPREIMLQVHTADGSWEHRAFWGENLIGFGVDGSPARIRLGELPASGEWVELEVRAEEIGLAPGAQIDGLAFSQHAGVADWARAGVVTDSPVRRAWGESRRAWFEAERLRDFVGLPEALRTIARTAPDDDRLTRFYLERVHEPTRLRLVEPMDAIRALEGEIAAIEADAPRMPIMREQAPEARRITRLLERGSFLSPADTVEPGTPEVFDFVSSDEPSDRSELAAWLTDHDNPLTARVTVNRFWESFFGRGLVETTEDFGTQGSLPTHPGLLDWLAVRFVEDGWSVKALCRRIVTSATYRQAANATDEARVSDPRNELLGRAPRFRLEGEMIRDSALAVSGLLSTTIGGPPVFPPQPDGIWKIVYNGDTWQTSVGQDRYRRGLYTFWRRTSPYPSFMTFDAPSREFCVPRRIRTNTPLQSLVTLNDPVYVEAAQALARRMMREADDPGDASSIADRGMLLCLSRHADATERAELVSLYEAERRRLEADPAAARALAGSPPVAGPQRGSEADIAAWTSVALVLLNLDEFLSRG